MARIYFIVGIIALVINAILTISELPETFWIGFARSSTIGLALAAMVIGLIYTSRHLAKLITAKRSLFGRK